MFFAQVYAGPKTLYIYDDSDKARQLPLCAQLAARDDVVFVCHEPVKLPVKRNRMMRAAIAQDPDAIYFTWDDDDYHGPGQLQRQVEPLLAQPTADACIFCPLLWFDQPTQTLTRTQHVNLHGLRLRVFTDAAIAFRRRFWERLPWDETVDPNGCWRWFGEPHDVIVAVFGARDYVIVRHTTNHMSDHTDLQFWSTNTEGVTVDQIVQLLAAPLPCER